MFQKCALKWVSPHQKTKDEYGQYDNFEGSDCSMQPPPSAQDEVCKSFHEKIAELRYRMLKVFPCK